MTPYQPQKVDNEMLKKGLRIIGKSSQVEGKRFDSEPFQKILGYSQSFRKVKNVLGAELFFKYGTEAYVKAQDLLFMMCTPTLKQVEGAKRLFRI